ncbi:DNA mismatch repair protein MutS [Halorubraceae archaeon YAN]|nr:DNA mismatch repair protein MutS [Halorubraceae archaeon YAN]
MADGIVGQFLSLKAESGADLLAMQCGDFYEFFAEDAEIVGDELDLTVSQKSSHGSSYPMAGVPLSELTPYLKALVERGYRVAVADQHKPENGDIYREISRIATPGTLLETSDAAAQYLAAVVSTNAVAHGSGDGVDGPYGLAFADITTGRFLVTAVETVGDAHAELYRFAPAEILPGPGIRNDDAFLSRLREETPASLTLHRSDAFAPGRSEHAVRSQFGKETIDSIGLESTVAIQAAGGILSYIDETGVGVSQSMTRLQTYTDTEQVALDATTQRNLELVETMQGDRRGSLIDTIDHTVTSPGGRLLREWITRPQRDRSALQRRHDAVEALGSEALARDRLRETLSDAYDLERLASRSASGSADARDLQAVEQTLSLLPALAKDISETALAQSPVSDMLTQVDQAQTARLQETLESALADEPPKTVRQGGLFSYGYHDELDGLIEKHEAANEWLGGLAGRVKSEYGLSHVTVDRNKTDGYYIQVGKSQADSVPDHFRHIKTLKNSKRFVTEELTERERQVLRLEEARSELEYELFVSLREEVAAHAELLQDVGRTLAEIDTVASLAEHAARSNWVRPTLTDAGTLSIEAGRHPVVETTTEFVPNDLLLDDDRGFLIVTGPNMSGKSTYMRQAALITLLAQAGSFVPATNATIGVVDGIYTRVGALDELAQGRSTFMVEMQELSNILHSATEESLVILDEVGRGTATYDGISIAWAATEYLHNEVRSKTLFATHYHELTTLASHLPRVENVHVAADERDGDVTFLRTIRDGPTDRSYGIHVADLAGVPQPVVSRADEVLTKLREEKAIEAKGGSDGEPVQTVFNLGSGQFASENGTTHAETAAATDQTEAAAAIDPKAEAVIDELGGVDVNSTSPIELMTMVQEWQQTLRDRDS